MISLKTKQEIEKRIDDIVEMAQNSVDETGVYKEKDMGKAQIRNILDIATSTDSVKAIVLFIQYQMGRKKLPLSFGEKLLDTINQLHTKAKEVEHNQVIQNTVWLKLIQLYLGFVMRYFVYKKGEET